MSFKTFAEGGAAAYQRVSMCVCVFQLCKAGLKTLQDLGPEMRLALNEDLEEDEEEEEEAILDEEGLEENAVYKV